MAWIFSRTKSASRALAAGLTSQSLNALPMATSSPRSHRCSKRRRRSSSSSWNAPSIGGSFGTPIPDQRASSRYSSRRVVMASRLSSGTGPLWAGKEKFGVRWNTVSWAAWRAMIGMDWIPLEPVPITATRIPVKSTPSWGQRLVA